MTPQREFQGRAGYHILSKFDAATKGLRHEVCSPSRCAKIEQIAACWGSALSVGKVVPPIDFGEDVGRQSSGQTVIKMIARISDAATQRFIKRLSEARCGHPVSIPAAQNSCSPAPKKVELAIANSLRDLRSSERHFVSHASAIDSSGLGISIQVVFETCVDIGKTVIRMRVKISKLGDDQTEPLAERHPSLHGEKLARLSAEGWAKLLVHEDEADFA